MIDEKTLQKYRNKVLSRTNHTDMLVSSIICIHYFGGIPTGFISNVLYQLPLSFTSRINMLNKILKEKKQSNTKLITKLKDMATIRNIFAHCELKIKIKGKEEYIFNPKNFHKPIDFEKEYKKFIEIDNEVSPILFNLYKEIGGILLDGKPTM